MQSTAMLEIKQSLGGPYPSQEAALQDHAGVLPPDAILMQGHANPGSNEGDAWYLVSRVSAVRGKDLRDAQPGRDQNAQPSVVSRSAMKAVSVFTASPHSTSATAWPSYSTTKCRKSRTSRSRSAIMAKSAAVA